jgi:hexosaminidase
MKLIFTWILVMVGTQFNFSQVKGDLMPYPAKIEFKEGKFRLEKEFTAAVKGNPNERVFPAASRMLGRLSGRTGLFFQQDFITQAAERDTVNLFINVKREGMVVLKEDESYKLRISNKEILIDSETDLGAMHGMETLLQLLNSDDEGYYFPAVEIEDKPRFPWRGLLIDVSRHFMPVEVIKRNLDGMSAVKLNVLHWHLSDDQGFRVECKSMPKLHELASDGFYYTHEQVKEVLKYAEERGIRVVPEFDVPGHATAWFAAYPEYASAPGPYTIERNWGIFDPTFDPTNEGTYIFLETVFKEMGELFPDEYFHIGGDENKGKQWDANPKIQQFMKDNNIKDNHELQLHFNKRILAILTKYNKKMMGWDEIFQPGLPTDIVVHSWRGIKSLVESSQKGYMGILSNGYYIDLMHPAEKHYLIDPIPADSPLNEKEKDFILGGEATMWAELITYETIDSRIWPRTAAIAERFWSPQEIRDVDDMYRRLDIISLQLEEHGLTHLKNQDMMLRRLVKGREIGALKLLMGVIEPVKEYRRHFQGVKYRSYSPYTRLVDAAMADAPDARRFNNAVEAYLEGDKSALVTMNELLNSWRDNRAGLEEVMRKVPAVREIDSLSMNLKSLSEAALEAVSYIEEGKTGDEEWVEAKMGIVNEAKKPAGQTEIVITPAVEKLINKAGRRNNI